MTCRKKCDNCSHYYTNYDMMLLTAGYPNAAQTTKEKQMELLPRIVYQMCVHGGLLVGSVAKKIMGEVEETHDYDVLVPAENWQTIALLIPEDAKPNKFGGWRFEDDKGNEIDVWPGSLHQYLRECKTKYGGAVYAVDYIHNIVYSSKAMPVD